MSFVEQELLNFSGAHAFTSGVIGVRVAQSLVFMYYLVDLFSELFA